MMDLSMSEADLAFADEVRELIAQRLRPEWRGVSDATSRTNRAVTVEWIRVLAKKGWMTSGWPAKYGGRQLTPMEKYILAAESARARAPATPHMEFGMVAPLIYTFGSQEQQDFFLPRILSGEDLWAQGFSEPNSGSDLASLKTSAKRNGDHYVVQGQKIWTTYAHLANHLFCLVRTDPNAAKPQLGISMLLIPMNAHGITIRPIRTIDGRHHFNEVFLDNVIVPSNRLLGAENRGWDYAKALLQSERQGIADVQPTRTILDDVAAVAAQEPAGDGLLIDDSDFGRRLAMLEIELDALEIMELKAMESVRIGTGRDHDPSMLKLLGSRLKQDCLMLGVEALGKLAEVYPDHGAPAHRSGYGRHFADDALFYRCSTIIGGTSEVQRNIMAKILIGANQGY